MTLQRFLTRTATVPTLTLRHALTLAMSVERPTSREGYARFYGHVLEVLDATGHPDCDVAAQRVLEGTTTTEGGMTSTPIAAVHDIATLPGHERSPFQVEAT